MRSAESRTVQDSSTKEEVHFNVECDVEPPPINECKYSLELKGPFSPLEMQIYSVISSGSSKKVSIEGNSVNAVLLDTEPQDPHERYDLTGHFKVLLYFRYNHYCTLRIICCFIMILLSLYFITDVISRYQRK